MTCDWCIGCGQDTRRLRLADQEAWCPAAAWLRHLRVYSGRRPGHAAHACGDALHSGRRPGRVLLALKPPHPNASKQTEWSSFYRSRRSCVSLRLVASVRIGLEMEAMAASIWRRLRQVWRGLLAMDQLQSNGVFLSFAEKLK